MISVEKSVTIRKPIEEVFAYTTNVANATEWQGGVESVEVEGDPAQVARVGTRYTEVRKFLGREMRTEMEITAYEPTVRWAATARSGPVPYTVVTTFTPDEGGTMVFASVEGEPSGFFKLAQGAVQGQLDKSLEEDLQRLRQRLETGSTQI